MVKVYNNSMVRPKSFFDFLKTIIFSEKMKLYLFQIHKEFKAFIQVFLVLN